jgi:hypothetical protein
MLRMGFLPLRLGLRRRVPPRTFRTVVLMRKYVA